MLLSHMNLMKKLKINIQDSINMKVQFDLRNVKDLSNISQAIKVLATTLKNIYFDVLVMEKLSNTFSDTNNLKVIYNPLKECDYLITLSHDDLKLDNLISLKLLKAKDNVIYLANLNNTKDSFEDILNKFKQSYLYKEEYTYALLNSYSLEGDEFNKLHKEDDKYKGIISPIDIVKVNPNLIISSYFDKAFDNISTLEDVESYRRIYLNNDKVIFVIEDERSYSYYYSLFYRICSIIKQ